MPFPIDDYTPHGYLDTPTHSRNLTPRGVLRSHGAGFRWHFPAYPGMYGGRRETYRAGFRVGVAGTFALADLDAVTSSYHSKNCFVFDIGHRGAQARVEWQLVDEHALHAILNVRQASRVTIHVEYSRLLAASGEWGESGLVGRMEDGLLILQGFEDGEAFALWCSQPAADLGIAIDQATAAAWAAAPAPGLPPDGFLATLGRRGERAALYAVLGFGPQGEAPMQLEVILARGRTAGEARRNLAAARSSAPFALRDKRAEDDAFWACAPRLAGDWPAHWRRGLVYDLETLRMMVRQPLGIYRHIWDAMQIQAPRVVLAEAAIDALLLAYADPQLAQSLLLSTFRDAPLPNVPCSREDGSYNMVAADGTVCGTAPAWGYPFLVLEWLYAMRPDQSWLLEIYPYSSAHLSWWLHERRAADGGLFYACSWESGQDDSPRFGEQPLGGGHPVRHIRPVDLHAALAHAAAVLARFAAILEIPSEQTHWVSVAAEFGDRTAQLWDGGRYADFDARASRFTAVEDVMLLAPLALRLPELQPVAAQAIQAIDADTLVWPMFAWTAVEAALAAGLPEKAAELAAAVCERAYRFWDDRVAAPDRTLPGIACEYWPLDGRCGGEGYGWGAFTTHLLLHALVGLTPAEDGLGIRPNLPPGWRVAGRRYEIQLCWRDRPLAILIEPLDGDRVALTLNARREEIGWGEELVHT
jgi:hypothetical protein